MPKLGTYRSVQAYFTHQIERYTMSADALYTSTTEENIDTIEWRLRQYGLMGFEIKLVLARFIGEKTINEIVKEQGWTSVGSANYHLKQALTKLKDRKFKL